MPPSARSPIATPPGSGQLRRRALVLGGALALLPARGFPYGGAKAPPWRPAVPPPVQALIDASGLPAASFGLHVQPVGRREQLPLVSLNADELFQLASTAKIVTSLAALDLLGPHYRWATHAYLDGLLHDGKLLGDLHIVGGGDASLTTAGLRDWFWQLQTQGLQEVWGDIVLDRLAFRLDESDHATTPPPSPERPHHARPDALTLDSGVVRVALHGSSARRTDVSLTPGLNGLRVFNELTAGDACSATAHIEQRNGDSLLVVRGVWSAACGGKEIAQLALAHPEFTTRAVAALWLASGGRLKGRVVDKRAPDGAGRQPQGPDGQALAPWSSHWSDPLPVLIREINKRSDNLAARNLLLSLVPGFPTQAATLPVACARVRRWLAAQGLAAGDIEVDSGAGLSRAERGKPRALVRLLRNSWNGRRSKTFVDSLPVAGVDGTLAARLGHGAATGRARLKTGSLGDTRALAGYVQTLSGRMLAVAAIVNHPEAAGATSTLDALIEWVAAHG